MLGSQVCTTLGANPETIPVLLELLQLLGEEADHVMEDYKEVPMESLHPLIKSAKNSAIPVLSFLHQVTIVIKISKNLQCQPESTFVL